MDAAITPMMQKHYPVLLKEIISIISPQYGGTFIDCTFGQGGYTKKILEFDKTRVIALDRDAESKKVALKLEEKFEDRFKFKNIKFSQLKNLKLKNENVRGVLFDLGYSFTQIKDPNKGLSFDSVGKLNMQLGLNSFSAEEAINKLDQKELEKIFKFFGDEKEGKFIARNIVKERINKKNRFILIFLFCILDISQNAHINIVATPNNKLTNFKKGDIFVKKNHGGSRYQRQG